MSDSEDGQLQSPCNDDDEQMSTGMDDVDNDDDDEEERDADSLNIKPPQAIVTHSRERDSHGLSGGRRGKDKLRSSKEKKHSKERRHKERSSLKERELLRGERERERRDYTSSGGGGGGGSSSERRRDERGGGAAAAAADMDRYSARGNYERGAGANIDESHDTRRSYARHFERGGEGGGGRGNHYHHQHYHQQYHHIQPHMQQQQRHHDYYERTGAYHHHGGGGGGGGGGMDYHGGARQYNKHSSSSGGGSYGVGGNHHDAGGERDRDRERERERRKYASANDQPPKDGESIEQDLRSRLLSKQRHKLARSSGGDLEERFDNDGERVRERPRREKKRDAGVGNNSVIEVLDSPEVESGNHYKSRHRHKNRKLDRSPAAATVGGGIIAAVGDKRKTPDDPELIARRAKFLAAEREKELRKESSREELQARREMQRERERNDNASGALSPSAVAASVTAGLNVIKRKVNVDDDDGKGERQSKRKRSAEKLAKSVVQEEEADDHDDSDELEESGGGDDDSISLSASEDDSESHSDSGAAVSVKSVSPPTAKGKTRKHDRRHRVDRSDRESRSRSKDDDHAIVDVGDDDDDSDQSYYEKIKSKRKISKRSKAEDAAGVPPYNNNDIAGVHSDIESRSASASPVESEDSFYANRKRDKRAKAKDGDDGVGDGDGDESSPDRDRHAKSFYRSSKASKLTSHKSKKRSKAKRRDEEGDESGSPAASEGSVKAHRARKNRRKKSSGDEDSVSRSDDDGAASDDVDSEDSYYEKKKRHHRHHYQKGADKEAIIGKSKRKPAAGDSDISVSSVSDDSHEGEEDDDYENGVHGDSGSDDGHHERKSRRHRKYSHEANQFLADINDVDMKDLSKDGARKDRRGNNGAESGGASVTPLEVDDEMETVYDDKGVPLPNYYPGIQGCRTVEEFQCLNRIEEGTYGVVYRARDQRTNEIVALKRLKMEKEREGFPITSLREINTLLKGQHPNIVTVREIVVGSNMDKIFIVMDYVEHDLKSLMETMKGRKQIFFPGEVKCLTQQLLRAVGHLHDNWILHRDLKTSNLLLSHKGILKVGDFGLAREYGSPLRKYTSLVVTRWYRAPELLLCSPMYSTPIDIWSVGCIFAEFLLMTPYLPGKSDIDQLNRIFRELGTPNEKIWPGYNELPAVKNVLSQNTQFAEYPMSNLRKRFSDKVSDAGMSLLQGLLTYDPKQRLTAEAALEHVYFKELPLPIDPSMFPTWPAKSEMGSARKAAHSPKPPSGGAQFKQLGQDDIAAIGVGGGGKASGIISGSANQNSNNKVVSGIITGNKKTAANTGFVLNAGIDQRQLAMGPGFNLKF